VPCTYVRYPDHIQYLASTVFVYTSKPWYEVKGFDAAHNQAQQQNVFWNS